MAIASNPPYSNNRVLWHVLLLYITTCGLYFFYWFYKTSELIYNSNAGAIKPIWRTLGLLVPLLNIYLLWKLFADVKKRTDTIDTQFLRYPSLLALIFILLSALYRLPSLYSFLGFSSVFPVLLVQRALNLYWTKLQPDLPARTKLFWPEILICIIGSILLILAIIGAGLSPTVE